MTAHAGYYGPEILLDAGGRPLRLINVVILQADGTTPAVLYTDRTKAATAPSNAVQTDGGGNLAFYADPGQYVLRWTVAGVTHTLTVEMGQDFSDQGGAVQSVNGRTGAVVLTASDVGADPSGAAASAVTTHAAATDPHGDRAYTDTQVATRATAAALTTETARATAAEQTNATAIATETTRAQAAEAAISAGLQFKAARVVATSNVASRSGLATIDGVTLSAGDLVLLVAQSSGSQNGLWRVASGAWTRPTNYAPASDATAVSVWIEDGTANKSSVWVVAGSPPNVVDTNVTTWQQASGLGEVIAGTGIVKTGNTLSTDPAVVATVAGSQLVVVHGATAGTARPTGATVVHWIGSVAPTNAATNDEWTDTANKIVKRWNGTSFDSLGSAAYETVVVLPKPSGDGTGATDTAALNALLATSAGKRIVASVHPLGVAYQTNAPLVGPSGGNYELDSPPGAGFTLVAGSNCNIFQNYAQTVARSVKNIVTTSGSAAITSTDAAFVAGDVGKAIRVQYAGPSGGQLDTTIASVTDGTHATLAVTASATVTSGGSIGPRDSNITISGGAWTRALSNGTAGGAGVGQAQNLNSLNFRHADGLRVRQYAYTGLSGKYAVSVADVTDYFIEDGTYSTVSDGVHVDGWSYRGTVRRLSGATNDDFVGVTGNPGSLYTATSDTVGDVIDLTIEDVRTTAQTSGGYAVSVVGDPDSTTYATKNITIIRCGDKINASSRAINLSNGMTGVDMRNCYGQITLTTLNGGLTTRVFSGIRISGHRFGYVTSGSTQAILTTNTTIADLTVDGVTIDGSPGTTAVYPLVLGPGTVYDNVVIKNTTLETVGGSICYAEGASSVGQQVVIENCYRDGQDYSAARFFNLDTSASLALLKIVNSRARRCLYGINVSMTGTLQVHCQGFTTDASVDVRAFTATLVVRGVGNSWGASGVATGTGGVVRSVGDLTCDLSTLGTAVGDMAWNTSNANTGTLGVGPAVCIATSAPKWRSLVSTNTW